MASCEFASAQAQDCNRYKVASLPFAMQWIDIYGTIYMMVVLRAQRTPTAKDDTGAVDRD